MVPNYAHWLTDFRTVFVFALGPFLPMFVIFFDFNGNWENGKNSDGHKWPNMAKIAIYGHLAIGPCATNSGKWGIREKNNKNVAQ